jgi:hypothetical protein
MKACHDRQYESSQLGSCQAGSSLLQYSRIERDEHSSPRSILASRSVFGDHTPDDDRDVVSPTAVERILNKILTHLTR